MRTILPFNGLIKAKGHIIYQMCLFITSYYIFGYQLDEADSVALDQEVWTQCYFLLNCFRGLHAFLTAMHVLRVMTDNEENEMIHQIAKSMETYTYIGSILYLQFYLNHNPPMSHEHLWIQECKRWLFTEICIFFCMLFNSAIFLFYIQIRGTFGFKNDEANMERFKYDALDYYEKDIDWLSFQLVPLMIYIIEFKRVELHTNMN